MWGETAGVKGQLGILYPLLFILQVGFCNTLGYLVGNVNRLAVQLAIEGEGYCW